MAKLVINVDVEIEDDIQAKVTINGVKDSQGTDITDTFRNYCEENKLPLDTQDQIEKAAVDFANANKSSLP